MTEDHRHVMPYYSGLLRKVYVHREHNYYEQPGVRDESINECDIANDHATLKDFSPKYMQKKHL